MEPFSLLQYAANYYSTRLDEMKTPAGECHTLVNADFDFAQGERARLSTARSRQHNPRLMNDEGGPTPLGQAAYGRAVTSEVDQSSNRRQPWRQSFAAVRWASACPWCVRVRW